MTKCVRLGQTTTLMWFRKHPFPPYRAWPAPSSVYRLFCFCVYLLFSWGRLCVCVCVCSHLYVSVEAAAYPSPYHLAAPTEPVVLIMNGLPALPAVAIQGRTTYNMATYLKWTKYYIAAYLLGWWALDMSHYLLERAAAMWEQRFGSLGYKVCVCVCMCLCDAV